MSSTNKTENLQLNSWIGADIPSREDFNRDNALIDTAVGAHTADTDIHTSPAEKTVWNSPYYISSYFGNGNSSRNITLDCDFTPSWGIVFAVASTPGVSDFTNKAHYNYFAMISTLGSNVGVVLNNKQIKVIQSSTAVLGNEYRSFNENGTTYVYIVFR